MFIKEDTDFQETKDSRINLAYNTMENKQYNLK